MKKQILVKALAVVICVAGLPAGLLMVSADSPDRQVIFGIMLGFALAGLFVRCLIVRNTKVRSAAALIIIAGGFISGTLIGHRVGYSPAPPWAWDRGCYFQVVVGPHTDKLAALIPRCVFLVLGLTLLFATPTQNQPETSSNGGELARTRFVKGIILAQSIIFGAAVALALSFLIFGTETIFIADYMPPVSSTKPPFEAYIVLYLGIHLSVLLVPITAVALAQIFALRKAKVLSVRKDIEIVLLFWIIPMIVCAMKLVPQYGSTC